MNDLQGAGAAAPSRVLAFARTAHRWPALLVAVALSACAPMITSQPATLAAAAPEAHEFTLPTAVTVPLSTGYSRVIPARSRWRESGRLAQGVVYRPLNTVFAIEGRHVHEAHLVVVDGALVGFYLPGEARYSTLDTSIRLPMGEPQ